jgi:hypothetical protein
VAELWTLRGSDIFLHWLIRLRPHICPARRRLPVVQRA